MTQPARRLRLAVLAFLLGGGLVGGFVGNRVRADARPLGDEIGPFTRVFTLIEDQYVGELDSKELVENAIGGLLSSLDPHSNYLDADSFSDMRDEQRGRFFGLGIQITKRGPDKPLTIIAPIDGTPASRAGLQSGDVIAEIEGEPTIDLTVQQAVRRLKGDRGTKVSITIQRPGSSEPFGVTIERDEIPIQSVRVAYMLDPDVGVVRVSNFTNTTSTELEEAVASLTAQGMKRLVLDLRGNPGGLLDQAVEVSEHFVSPGQLVVYTKGRISGSNQRFEARKVRTHVDLPLTVLVDHSSASASEIVSGAIQDHDRGLVIGETTFGKGLVQRVIPLQNGLGGALAVTTAKYYTPSGRLIQRDYSDLDDYYLTAPDELEQNAAPPPPDKGPREVFHTASGREVFGGGGITPDYIVATPKSPDLVWDLRRENVFFDFAVIFVSEHPDLEKSFVIDAPIVERFEHMARERGVEVSAEALAEARDEILLRLRAQIARIKWDQVEEARILAEQDPQIQKAIETLGEAERLALRASEIEPRSKGGLRAEAEPPGR